MRGFFALFLFTPGLTVAQTAIPETVPAFQDDFERGTLEDWVFDVGGGLELGGHEADPGSRGFEIVRPAGASSSHILRVTLIGETNSIKRGTRVPATRADEGYLTFWFDPNSARLLDLGAGGLQGRSLRIAAIEGPGRTPMVGLAIRQAGSTYEAFLQWRDENGETQHDQSLGSFNLQDRGQEITIGFRRNDWVACWVNGARVRSRTGVTHLEPYGAVIELGEINDPASLDAQGSLLFDDVVLAIPRVSDLWVDQTDGDDAADGLTPGSAFATISRAADLAGAGTTVHIRPGVYRESVVPAQGGQAGEPLVYRAEAGPGSVKIRGSVKSSSLGWTRLSRNSIGLPAHVEPSSIWWTDLSAWQLAERPLFLVLTGSGNTIAQNLPEAHEPDWTVPNPHKYSEHWWVANGGRWLAGCDPSTDPDSECDLNSRSALDLVDDADDVLPAGIEGGNLSSLGSLVGATLVARDAAWGHRICRRRIVAHIIHRGKVTIDSECPESDGDPGLGWGSQYFVEGHPALLDVPGEWWFDPTSGRLYLWPPVSGNPDQLPLEISRRSVGLNLKDRSHVELRDLDFELFNDAAIQNSNNVWRKSVGNRVSGCALRYSRHGIRLGQETQGGVHLDKRIESFAVENNEISNMGFLALSAAHRWDNENAAGSWERPGVFDVVVRGNRIRKIGLRPGLEADSASANMFIYADRLRFEDNSVSDTLESGLRIAGSVIQSQAVRDFPPQEIKTGEILIRGNRFERTCLATNDCGAVRILGLDGKHVFRDLLLMDNTFRDIVGWSWAAEKRGRWPGSQVAGGGGFGLYLDNGSGIFAFRNVADNNSYAGFHLAKAWRDGRVHYINNIAADNGYGIHMGGLEYDTHTNVDTWMQNNILINNKAYGVKVSDLDYDYTNTAINRNLYFGNGWGDDVYKPGAMKIAHGRNAEYLETLADIQTESPFEAAGRTGNPSFLLYDPEAHYPNNVLSPSYELLPGSRAIDGGTSDLPTALKNVLDLHGIWAGNRIGARWDQGVFEGLSGSCKSRVIGGQTVSGAVLWETCHRLQLGPNLEMTSTARVQARALIVVLDNDVTIRDGARFEAESGVFPPDQ